MPQLAQGAGFHGPSLADDADAVAERLDLGQHMAGEQDRTAAVALLGDAALEDPLHQRVEPGGRLVEDEQIDIGGEGGNKGDLLAVALGVRPPLPGGVEFEPLQQLGPARGVEPSAQPPEEVDDLTAGEIAPQGHIAGDIGDPAVQCDGVLPGVPAQQPGRAAVGAQQAEQDADRRGLAGRRRARGSRGPHRPPPTDRGRPVRGCGRRTCGDRRPGWRGRERAPWS